MLETSYILNLWQLLKMTFELKRYLWQIMKPNEPHSVANFFKIISFVLLEATTTIVVIDSHMVVI